jgi:phosphate acetyltransferase
MPKTIFSNRIAEKISTGSYKSEEPEDKKPVLEKLAEKIQLLKQDRQRIVFPEPLDERVLKAVDFALREGFCKAILVGEKSAILKKAGSLGIDLSKAVISSTSERFEELVELLLELRKEKGLSRKEAEDYVKDPVYYAALLVKAGYADGLIGGAASETGKIASAALRIIKPSKETKTVSGSFVMVVPIKKFGEEFAHRGVFVFADCAVTVNPTAEQIADIAFESAKTARMFGLEPRIALLYYRTRKAEDMEAKDKMQEAEIILKKRKPDFIIEGELQVDAAIDPEVALIKNPESVLKGRANVLIFPDLSSGNIGYKLVERLAGAEAIGPIIQGLSKPCNDLSRGCSIEDIINMIAITCHQAISSKNIQKKQSLSQLT